MQSMSCVICKGNFSEIVRYPGYGAGTHSLSFDRIGLCSACGSGTALPRFDQNTLDAYYASGAYWDSTDSAQQLVHAANQAKIRLASCLPYVESGIRLRVADIGSGYGFIAREAAKAGLHIAGYDFVEPDNSASAHLDSRELPFPVRRIGSIGHLDSKADLVFVNQVIEHVADLSLIHI